MSINNIIKKLNDNIKNHNKEEFLTTKKIKKYNQELKNLSKELYKKTKNL